MKTTKVVTSDRFINHSVRDDGRHIIHQYELRRLFLKVDEVSINLGEYVLETGTGPFGKGSMFVGNKAHHDTMVKFADDCEKQFNSPGCFLPDSGMLHFVHDDNFFWAFTDHSKFSSDEIVGFYKSTDDLLYPIVKNSHYGEIIRRYVERVTSNG